MDCTVHKANKIGNTALNNVQPISWFAQLQSHEVTTGTMDLLGRRLGTSIKYAFQLNFIRISFSDKKKSPMVYSSVVENANSVNKLQQERWEVEAYSELPWYDVSWLASTQHYHYEEILESDLKTAQVVNTAEEHSHCASREAASIHPRGQTSHPKFRGSEIPSGFAFSAFF